MFSSGIAVLMAVTCVRSLLVQRRSASGVLLPFFINQAESCSIEESKKSLVHNFFKLSMFASQDRFIRSEKNYDRWEHLRYMIHLSGRVILFVRLSNTVRCVYQCKCERSSESGMRFTNELYLKLNALILATIPQSKVFRHKLVS